MYRYYSTIILFVICASSFAQSPGVASSEDTKAKPAVYLGLEAGYMSISSKGWDSKYDLYLSSDFKKTSAIIPGAFIQIQKPGKHFMFSAGLQVVKYTFESDNYYREGADYHDYILVSYGAIKIPLTVGRDFLTGNFRPFVRVGPSINIFMNTKSERRRELLNTNPPIVNTTPAFDVVKRPISGLIETGGQFKKDRLVVMLRLRYEISPAAFRENQFGQGQENIKQNTFAAILSAGYLMGQ